MKSHFVLQELGAGQKLNAPLFTIGKEDIVKMRRLVS